MKSKSVLNFYIKEKIAPFKKIYLWELTDQNWSKTRNDVIKRKTIKFATTMKPENFCFLLKVPTWQSKPCMSRNEK